MMKKWLLLLLVCGVAALLSAFEVTPRIYPADTEATITFRPETKWERENLEKIQVAYVSERGLHADGSGPHLFPGAIPSTVVDGTLTVKVMLRGEDRHTFLFSLPPKEKGKPAPVSQIEYLMTLKPDLFALRPFRGDIHQHSNVSDGKLAPEEHIRYARRAGFDFVGVSDHWRYKQNPRVIRTAAESGSGLTVYPAEEMHTPGAVLHSVCIGAPEKMSLSWPKNQLREDIAKIAEEIRRECPEANEKEIELTAQAVFVARRARAAGATVIYAHPFWVPRSKGKFQSPPFMTRYILTHKDFDAIEIWNGALTDGMNSRIAALLYELAAAGGRRWPVTCGSDCHNVAANDSRGLRYFNVIFAKDCTYPSFRDALINFRSAAGHSAKVGDGPTCYFGPLRIVGVADFLHQCGYWRRHLALCRKQEALIAKYLAGDKTTVPEIRELAAKIDALRENLFYRPDAK